MTDGPAPIGHNAPPPFDLFAEEIADLETEANNFLDGSGVSTEAEADAVSALTNRVRRLFKDADAARAAEKKPHDDAGKAVQARWKPLLDRMERTVTVAKRALTPFLEAKDRAQREEAARLAREAEEARLAALAAEEQVNPSSLVDQARVEEARKDAEIATKAAAKADKARPQATGGERAIGLRSRFTPVLTDAAAALRHYRERQPEALKEWLTEQAERDVRAGARVVPGFIINEERIAA